MTKTEFQNTFGTEWRKFASKPIFEYLLSVIEEEHPIRSEPVADGDKLHGAAVYLNTAYGYERLRKLLVSLAEEPKPAFEPEDKFKDSEM